MTQIYKGQHIWRQIFAFVVNDIEISPDGFGQGNHCDKFFSDVSLYQQIGKHSHADAF